jgi:hypothetical protein
MTPSGPIGRRVDALLFAVRGASRRGDSAAERRGLGAADFGPVERGGWSM